MALLRCGTGQAIPSSFDAIMYCGKEGDVRRGMYELNGVATYFYGNLENPDMFATVNTSNGNIAFTKAGIYQISTIKDETVTSGIVDKAVGDTMNFYGPNGKAYGIYILKIK